MRELSYTERRAYLHLTHFLNSNIHTRLLGIKSYYLKTAFLWTLEDPESRLLDDKENYMFLFITRVLEKLCSFYREKHVPNFFIKEQNLLEISKSSVELSKTKIEAIHDKLCDILSQLAPFMLEEGLAHDYGIPTLPLHFFKDMLMLVTKEEPNRVTTRHVYCYYQKGEITAPFVRCETILQRIPERTLTSDDASMMLAIVMYIDILQRIGCAISKQNFNGKCLDLATPANLAEIQPLSVCLTKIWQLCCNLFRQDITQEKLIDLVQNLHIPLEGDALSVNDSEANLLKKVKYPEKHLCRIAIERIARLNKLEDMLWQRVCFRHIKDILEEVEKNEKDQDEDAKIKEFFTGDFDIKIDNIVRKSTRYRESFKEEKEREFRCRKAESHPTELPFDISPSDLIQSISKLKRNLVGNCNYLTKIDDIFTDFISKGSTFIETKFIKCSDQPLSLKDIFIRDGGRIGMTCSLHVNEILEDFRQMYRYGFKEKKFSLPCLSTYIDFKCQYTINQRTQFLVAIDEAKDFRFADIWSYWVGKDSTRQFVGQPQNTVII